MCLLLVEGSSALRDSLAADFRRAGHDVEAVGDVERARALARERHHDVVVLDAAVVGPDWAEQLARFRDDDADPELLLLTRGDSAAERVRGLNAGADDCVTRPCPFEELLARVRALLRDRRRVRSAEIRVGDLSIDTTARTVQRAGFAVRLTWREYQILEYLGRHVGRTVSLLELEDHLYGPAEPPLSNSIASAICHLRRKLGETKRPDRLLETLRGRGYRLGAPLAG